MEEKRGEWRIKKWERRGEKWEGKKREVELVREKGKKGKEKEEYV